MFWHPKYEADIISYIFCLMNDKTYHSVRHFQLITANKLNQHFLDQHMSNILLNHGSCWFCYKRRKHVFLVQYSQVLIQYLNNSSTPPLANEYTDILPFATSYTCSSKLEYSVTVSELQTAHLLATYECHGQLTVCSAYKLCAVRTKNRSKRRFIILSFYYYYYYHFTHHLFAPSYFSV